VEAGRHAGLSPLLRARRLRLRRHAGQRREPAGLQGAAEGFGAAHQRRAHARFSGAERSGRGHGPQPGKERLQSPEERERFDDTTKCILCGACTTSCPSFWSNPDYVGPAAIVQAHRFLFDSRDEGGEERLAVLGSRDGVWRCRTIYNCTDACPRDIEVTRAIGEVKKALLFRRS
jgi:succinate dehydrogenase/fumarate reductase-like Fe-S protein